MKLIDKDALVAEIKRHISIAESQLTLFGNEDERNRILWAQQKKVCEIILSFLDTLEVKEVDLEKEYKDFLKCDNGRSMFETAKHFFELGLSVSNSTKVTTLDIDDVLKENGVNPYSKEAKIIKESYFMAIEKLAQKGEKV